MLRASGRDLIRIGILGALAAPAARAEKLARKLIVRSARPQDLETPVAAFSEEFTPNDLFFVRSHFGPPIIDPTSWRLRIEGMVDRPSELSISALKKLGAANRPAVLQCAGNGRALFRPKVAGAQWERGAVGQAMWRGVSAPLAAWFAQRYPAAEPAPAPATISPSAALAAVAPEREKRLLRGNRAAGAALYAKSCASCHGAAAEGLAGGPVLIEAPALYQRTHFAALVRKGKGRMPATEGMGDAEINNLLAFLRALH